MIRDILSELKINFQETRFRQPPKSTYAVYFDAQTFRGADGKNNLIEHLYTVELYAYKIDVEAETALETALDNRGLSFEKSDRQWLDTEQLYLIIYTFEYLEKRSI